MSIADISTFTPNPRAGTIQVVQAIRWAARSRHGKALLGDFSSCSAIINIKSGREWSVTEFLVQGLNVCDS